MKAFLIFFLVIAVSCNSVDAEKKPEPAISEVKEIVETVPAKAFKKSGIVKNEVDGLTVQKSSVNIWSDQGPSRFSIYKLSPGEEVVIYNNINGYLLLAPKSDTSTLGYLLDGWIDQIKDINE